MSLLSGRQLWMCWRCKRKGYLVNGPAFGNPMGYCIDTVSCEAEILHRQQVEWLTEQMEHQP